MTVRDRAASPKADSNVVIGAGMFVLIVALYGSTAVEVPASFILNKK